MIDKLISLKHHPGFIKYFKNTSWLFAEKILRMFVGLFVGVWVARYLGPEQFGLFNYALSFVGLFAVLSTLGLDGIVVRELVKDERRRDELMGTAFWLRLLGALCVIGCLVLAIHFTSNDIYTNILIFIIASATIFQSFKVVDLYFQSKVLSRYAALANMASLLISSLLKIVLILFEAPLIAFAWVVFFDSFVLACGLVFFYYKKTEFGIHKLRFKRAVAISLLKDSWPLILSGVVISIYMKIDQVMIKEMMNAEAVGQYAAAVRLSEAWYVVPMVITASLFPAIVNAKEQSKERYESRIQKLYDLMVWGALAVAIPMTVLSDWLIHLLYGEPYSAAGNVLMVHIWAGLFFALLNASGRWLINEGLTKIALYRNLTGVAINIILNYYLIQRYGIVGSAVATLISYAFAGYFFDLLNKKTRNNFRIKTNAFLLWRVLG